MKKKVFLMLFISVFLLSCSDDEDGSSTYAGPGSKWSLSVTGSEYTFSMEDGSNSMTINATSENLSTGHKKITVSSATASGLTPPNPGDVAHAIEVSGTAFLLHPFEAGAETIAMISAGTCPSTNFTANWVIGGRATAAATKITDNNGDWFGSISWNTSTGQASFPVYRSVEDPTNVFNDGNTNSIGTCSAGKVENLPSVDAYFTASGLVIVSTNVGTNDESHIIGIPQSTISANADAYGDYAGFIFDQENSATYPVTASVGAGVGSVGDISMQVRTGADLSGTGTTYTIRLNNLNSPANGMIRGQFNSCTGGSVSNHDGTCEAVCVLSENVNSSGKDFLYCIGQHPSDEDDRMTILLVEK